MRRHIKENKREMGGKGRKGKENKRKGTWVKERSYGKVEEQFVVLS